MSPLKLCKMGDSFTVKLDLSAVIHNEKERLYILLVDPARMKMIYQFKLWVRFLFSIENSIKFFYEGAAIHDLEDINILKLLKIVHIEHADCAVGEREQQEQLIAQLNKYNAWYGSSTPATSTQKPCELTNRDNFQSSNTECHDIRESKIESSELNWSFTNEQIDRQEINGRVHKNNLSSSSSSSSSSFDLQRDPNIENGTSDKSKTRNDIFGAYPRSLPSGKHDLRSDNYYNKGNSVPRYISKSDNSCNEAMKQRQLAKKKSAHKPFSLCHFLHTLKCQKSNVDDNKVKNDPAMELDKNETVDIKSNGEIFMNDKKEELLIKRKRKRIRKHKNQKHKVDPYFEIYKETLTSLFHDKENLKSPSLHPKPKHIRFDTDEENRQPKKKRAQDELVVINGNSNECHLNTGYEPTSDNIFEIFTSDDHENEPGTAHMATVEVNKTVQENDNEEFEAKNMSVTSGVEVNSSLLGDSSGNLLDILGSLRKKRNTPPVFDRFAACL